MVSLLMLIDTEFKNIYISKKKVKAIAYSFRSLYMSNC